jgi:hypothetical protein
MLRFVKTICLLFLPVLLFAQHPVTFFNSAEAALVKKDITRYPILKQSFDEIKKEVDVWLGKDVDVPFPKDPAGGYTHDKHKSNYMLMFNSGLLYNITGDARYATLVKDMLLKYAAMNPTLKNHPQATSTSPGRIFWQALNDANWMVYAGMAYDLIHSSLSVSECKKIENGAFKPEVDYFLNEQTEWFNRLHNHSVWACAGVGIIGIASNNKDYVDVALYGTKKDGKTGFIAQMDNLFSPDGYYTEGPYYVRYAILPYVLFANAINNTQPSLKVFEHRDRILQKALMTCLQQTNMNGSFFPVNDAIKDKDYTTNELVTAINIAWKAYGSDEGLLTVAKKQNRVMLNSGGVAIAAALATRKNISLYYPYKSIESNDGVKGDEGGLSVFRNGTKGGLSSLIFKYTSQGLGHGHFDKLNINFFDKGNEILTDYGSARFIGIEQKYGGRYLPENTAYSAQTIAHNTIVVDENSHFNGDSELGQQYHSQKLFSDISHPNCLVVAAKEDNAYKNVHLQRGLYSLQMVDGKKMIVDIFRASSPDEHQYDLPFQYSGQFINASFPYKAAIKSQEALGVKNGYQFIWKEAEAALSGSTAQFTFLNGSTYYSISSLIEDTAQSFFTRSGANDPNFNLRRDPAYIIRKKGKDQIFVNVIEIHGNYDPVLEFSSDSYPSVKEIKLLQNDDEYTIVSFKLGERFFQIAQCNKDFEKAKYHESKGMSWTGAFVVWMNGKNFN